MDNRNTNFDILGIFVRAPPSAFRISASIYMLCIPDIFTSTRLSNLAGTTTYIGFYHQKKELFWTLKNQVG